jgi:pimeloyl-ACP methyl ester carboxylesterase
MRTGAPTELAEWLLSRSPLTEAVRADAPKTDAQAISASFAPARAGGVFGISANLQTARLMIHGVNDQAVLPPDLDCVGLMPGDSHMITFEQSGHFPMLDEGGKFNRLMGDFLALASGESPRQLLLKEEWKRRVR